MQEWLFAFHRGKGDVDRADRALGRALQLAQGDVWLLDLRETWLAERAGIAARDDNQARRDEGITPSQDADPGPNDHATRRGN